MIKYFQIYGQRCSGTNFLEYAINENFKNLKHIDKYGWKHFFGYYEFKQSPDENETLFIGIVRNPINWIDSFFKLPHYIPESNKKDIKSFLFNEFYSVRKNQEMLEDRHIITKKRYKNIFEARKIKNNYLLNDMKNNVKNYILIRYEDLRDNYNIVLDSFKNKFDLIPKQKEYVKILDYKGKKGQVYKEKPILLEQNIIKLIKENLDIKQENILGYNL